MPAPRKLADADLSRLEEVCRQRDAIPTDKALAREMGVSVHTIYKRMRDFRKGVKLVRSTCNKLTPVEVAEAVMREYGLE